MHRLQIDCTPIDDSPLDGTSRALLNPIATGPPDGTSRALLNPQGMTVKTPATEIADADSRVVNAVPEETDPGIVPSHEIGRQVPVETHDHLIPLATRPDRNLLASSCRLKNTRNSKSRFAQLMPRSSNNSFLQEARHRPHPQVPLVDIAKHTLSTNHNSKKIPQTKFQN
jgi:hypothetical protein